MAHFFGSRKVTPAWAWERATGSRWAAGTWLLLLAAAWIVKGQISAIVGEVTPTGQYPVTAVTGLGQLTSLTTPPHAALAAWDAAAKTFPALASWLGWYLAADALFIAAVAMLGITWLKGQPARSPGRALLAAVCAAYAAEAVLAAITLLRSHASRKSLGVPQAMAWPLHVATALKWLAVLALLGWLVLQLHASHQFYRNRLPGPENIPRRGDGYAKVRRIGHALQIQRFSLVVVGLLALMAIGPPVNGTLEQMPDVQRAWLNTGSFLGLPQLALAALAQVLLALMLWSLGQMRAKRTVAKFTEARDPRHWPAKGVWTAAAVALAAVAAAAWATGAARVSAGRVAACVVVLLVVAGVSAAIDAWWPGLATPARPGPAARPARPRDVAEILRLAEITGSTLAVAAIAVTPLGIVRSFTAPALVTGGLAGPVAVAAGLAGAIVVPMGCWLICCWRPGRPGTAAAAAAAAPDVPALPKLPAPVERPESRRERAERNRTLAGTPLLLWVIGAVFALTDAWLVLDPLTATHVLGVLATAVVAIGSLGVLLGLLAYLVQTRQPLSLFRALRLDVTPVLTILALIAVAGGIADRNSALHEVSAAAGVVGQPRPPFAAVLNRWLASPLTIACAVPAGTSAAGHPIAIAPLVQVAASGGGVRAAWWTEEVLGQIASSPCGRHAVLDVSAVSGGAVGVSVLAAAAGSGNAPARAAHIALTTMADPDALAAGIDGRMLRDTIAGYTGLDLWAAGRPGGTSYPDRAALMQAVWQNQDPALRQPFPLRHSWLPWALLFNSTSVSTGCRAIISSVVLPRTATVPPGTPLAPCGLGTGGMPGAYDLFARQPCEKGISVATAALLSSRYAYITPSGTLEDCGGHGLADQLADGGYGDASGLSTLADLTPAVLGALRQYNAHAVAAARPGQPVTLVVPVTAYLGNSVQPARTLTPPSRTPEFDVPASARSHGPAVELTGTAALLQDIAAQSDPAAWLTC
ncbi:MAG TPA: hypothetical protein VF843_07360, partial [Streptosporangiaceae bacterium]